MTPRTVVGNVHVEVLEELGLPTLQGWNLIRGWNAPPYTNTSDPITISNPESF